MMRRSTLLTAAAGCTLAAGIVAACSGNPETAPDDPSATEAPAEKASPAPAPEPTEPSDDWLLPNLQSMRPEDVLIELADDGTRLLRFTSIIANTGLGPVETRPADGDECPPEQRHASHVIYHDVDGDGRFDRGVDDQTTTRPAGCMLDHPEHNHWHFYAAARYVLAGPGSDVPIVSADKVSFCWRDSREVPAEAVPRPDEHYGDCDRDTVQGISPGWADVYGENLPDQHLELPADLSDGRYCLWNEADPLGLLAETTDSDNWAVTAIEITGTEVTTIPTSTCDPSARP